MIGCIAKALDDKLHVDGEEMDDVRWLRKDAVQMAVQYSNVSDNVIAGAGGQPLC